MMIAANITGSSEKVMKSNTPITPNRITHGTADHNQAQWDWMTIRESSGISKGGVLLVLSVFICIPKSDWISVGGS